MKILKRAWSDTFSGQYQALFTLVVGGLFGLVYLYFDQGVGDAVAEVPYWEAAVFGSVGALSLLFVFNLICAPYRIERDEHEKTKAQLEPYLDLVQESERLKFELEKREFLTLREVVNICMPGSSNESLAKQMLLDALKSEIFEEKIAATGGNVKHNLVAIMGRDPSALSSTKKISKADAEAFAQRQGYSLN